MSQFALHLNEVVNRVFLSCTAGAPSHGPVQSQFAAVPRLQSVVYQGKHLPDRARVIELTLLVVSELQYAASVDSYLLRAVSRAILKSLSQFVTRIESLLVSPSRDPSAIVIPSTPRAAHALPAAMEFNLGLMALEWLVEESLERCLEGMAPLVLAGSSVNHVETASEELAQPAMPTFAHEILSPLREQMEASILHVVQPILGSLRASLTACILKMSPAPFIPRKLAADVPQPPWHRELEERLEAAHCLLVPRLCDRCGEDGHAWFISVAIHVIWKGLVVLTSRSVMEPVLSVESQLLNPTQRTQTGATAGALLALLARDASPSRRAPTPSSLAGALKHSLSRPQPRSRRNSIGEDSSGAQTPEEEPCQTLLVSADEPNGFVVNPLLAAEQLYDLQMFEHMVLKFCGDGAERSHPRRLAFLRRRPSISSPMDPGAEDEVDADNDLALSALHEALDAMQSTITVLRTLLHEPDALHRLKSEDAMSSLPQAFDVIPPVLLIHILIARLPLRVMGVLHAPEMLLPPPPMLYDYTWLQYESALMGFASGESASYALVQRYRDLSAQLRADIEAQQALADQDALLNNVRDDDASVLSYASSGKDIPPSMIQSAPALVHMSPSERGRERSTDARESPRSRSRALHRGTMHFWRRANSQTRQQHTAMFTALPPRVSRTHATSSPAGSRRESMSLAPRSQRRTLPLYAHLQRHGLDMADAVFTHIERVLS